MHHERIYCIVLVSMLLVQFGASSQFLGGLAFDHLERSTETVESSSPLLFYDGSVNVSGISATTFSNDVLLGFMGSPRASYVLLFYNPSQKRFTFKYHIEVTGEYLYTRLVKSAVTGIFVAFSLYYADAPLKQTIISYSRNVEGVITYDDVREYTLSSDPLWQNLKWNFIGVLWGKTWDAVKAEMQKKDIEWWKEKFDFLEATYLITLLIIGTAAACLAVGPEAAVAGWLLCNEIVGKMVKDLAEGAVLQWAYEKYREQLKNRAASGFWSCVAVGVDSYVNRDPILQIDVAGPNRGKDTRDVGLMGEGNQGPYELGDYIVHVTAYRINKMQVGFTTPAGASEIKEVTLEGDPDSPRPYHEDHKMTYEKEAVYRTMSDVLHKLMKHDSDGNPYVELFFHVTIDYETYNPRENDMNWNPGDFVEAQSFDASATGWGAGKDEVYSVTKEGTTKVSVLFVFFPTFRKAVAVVITLALLPLYIIYEKTKTIHVVIPYPPFKTPKYMLTHPPHIPDTGEIQYVGPQPPSKNIAIDVPDPSYTYVIWIPQTPGGQDWKITLAYESSFPFYYGQVVFIPATLADKKYEVQINIPWLEKYSTLSPPTAEEVFAAKATSPTQMMFIIPTLPEQDEVEVIDITNPNEALLVTAQTTSAYPLRISLNDIPRTTYIKIPSGGDLDLRVLKPGYTPSPTISDEQLGIYVNAGISSSYFEYTFLKRKIASGTLNIPTSVSYTIDYPDSGLTFAKDDKFPRISATLQAVISTAIQLVGHGVDLNYSYSTGAYVTNAFKTYVKNTGVVQDTFNLSIAESPINANVFLGNKSVTLNPGESAAVDLNITTLPPLNHLFGPGSTTHMMGINDQVYSGSYYVKVKAVCNANEDISDTVKVPVGLVVPFDTESSLGNTVVSTTLNFKNTFIRLRGNLTIEAGGRFELENSTAVIDPDPGERVGITVNEGGEIYFDNSCATSKDREQQWIFDIQGKISVAHKTVIKDSRISLLSNLELPSESQLVLGNSLVEVGKEGITASIVTHQGTLLNLLDSTIQSYNPSDPYIMRGGGRIVKSGSKIDDFVCCSLKIETLTHSQHIRYPEVANYLIRITNTGNQTDQITLHLEKDPFASEWICELDQTVFTVAPEDAAVTLLHVRRLTPVTANQTLEVDVIGTSSNDAEVCCSLKTFTKMVEPSPLPQIDVDSHDIFLTEESPVEGKTVEIKAIVHNNGDQSAHNLLATFFDKTASQLIDAVLVPEVAARNFNIVTTQWRIETASLHTVELTVQYSGGTEQAARGIPVKSCPQGNPSVMIDEDPPLVAYTGQPIYFDAFNFTVVDGNIIECLWDFADGAQASGPLIVYSYWEDGKYSVTLLVVDDQGAETEATTELTILNRPPTASATTAPSYAWIDESIILDAGSSFDLDGTIIQYTWDFGDGNSGNGKTVAHDYDGSGTYNVTMTATDNDGASASVQVQVTILNKILFADLDGDGIVNIVDVVIVAKAFGSTPSDELWNPIADLDGNAIINIIDIANVAKDFGKAV